MLQQHFKSRYFESLGFYKHFYDDIWQYGSEENPDKVFYFIPGINGTPGQIRFALPSIFKQYGPNIYIKCCYLEEFSSLNPIWDKYTEKNLDKKRQIIINDLKALSERYDEVIIVASSNGFYDFVSAYDELTQTVSPTKLKLLWSACAPDHFNNSKWEDVFYPINGFTHNNNRWIAYPNHNWLKFINPETTTKFNWRYGAQRKTIYKVDLESRFIYFNLYWAYVSIDCFNKMLQHNLRHFSKPMVLETHVLIASKDGYWQKCTKDEILTVINKYVNPTSTLFKDTSHLWIAAPEYLSELTERLKD